MFLIVTNKSKVLTKNVLYNCESKKHVNQIKSGIATNVYMSVKIMRPEKIIFGILLHVLVKMVNM